MALGCYDRLGSVIEDFGYTDRLKYCRTCLVGLRVNNQCGILTKVSKVNNNNNNKSTHN